jgi:uncharacterized protein YjiS (DUF1127 family)
MPASLFQPSITMSHAAPWRLWQRGAEAVRAAWNAARAARDERRRLSALAGLNEHTLRDIGAADWMIAQAADRHERERRQAFEWRRSTDWQF